MSVTPPRRAAPTPWWAWGGLTLLVALFFGLTLAASPHKSASFDEQYHLAAGYSYLKTGDYRLATTHPPLAGLLAVLPLLGDDSIVLPLDDPAWAAGNRFEFSDAFLWYANADPAAMLNRARSVIVLLGAVLVVVVFLWGNALHGAVGALLAAALVALDPNILANSRQVTTDLAVTLFLVVALWRMWTWLERGRLWDIVACGLAAGAAMASKYNGLLVWPTLIMVLLIHPPAMANSRRDTWVRRFLAFAASAAVGLVTLWAVYRFDAGMATLGPLTLPLPAPFYWTHLWQTLTGLIGENASKPDFLLGEVSTGGWWYYFPVAAAVKTPLPTLLLAIGGIAALAKGRGLRRQVALWATPLLVVAMALTGVLTIGYRHLLPALPFVCLLAGNNVRWLAGSHRRLTLAAGVALVAWLAFSTARFFPNHDAYFNELAGGWPHWSEILVDSNLDWGQDLPALRDVMAELGIDRVNLAYFGKSAPEAWGVAYSPLPGYLRFMNGREPAAFNPAAPAPGWYAISATSLRLGNLQPDGLDLYAYFRDRVPDARAGYSIYLYHVTDETGVEVRPLVVTGEPVWRAPVASLAGDGWRAQARWRGNESTVIEPAPATPSETPGYVPVVANLGGVFTLEGYQLAPATPSAGEMLELFLFWRRGSQPMPMPAPIRGEPLSAFVHLVDGDAANVVAQFDGWDTALRGLEEGDLIVQPATLDLPPSLENGRTYRLLAGLYSPQDGRRLVAPSDTGPIDAIELGAVRLAP